MTIHQFVPAQRVVDRPLDKEQWREVVAVLESDKPFEPFYAGYLAMRERVNNPRRRLGNSVSRAGPVLFDPCQYFPD